MAKEKKKDAAIRFSGMGMQIMLSIICILLGGILLYVPQVDVEILCVIASIILIVFGVVFIVYFFLSRAYKRLKEYNFSIGVLLLILGCCGLIQKEAVAASLMTYMGFVTLVLGIMMLQGTVQLTILGSRVNILGFIFTLLTLFGAIVIITGNQSILSKINDFPQIMLTVSGIMSLICLIMTAIVVKKNKKQEEKQNQPQNTITLENVDTKEPVSAVGVAEEKKEADSAEKPVEEKTDL